MHRSELCMVAASSGDDDHAQVEAAQEVEQKLRNAIATVEKMQYSIGHDVDEDGNCKFTCERVEMDAINLIENELGLLVTMARARAGEMIALARLLDAMSKSVNP